MSAVISKDGLNEMEKFMKEMTNRAQTRKRSVLHAKM